MSEEDFTLGAIAELLGATVSSGPEGSKPDADCERKVLYGLASLEAAGPEDLSFLANKKYLKNLENTRAAAVLLQPEHLSSFSGVALVVPDSYAAYARVSHFFQKTRGFTEKGVDSSASIHPSASIHESVSIGPNVVIGPEVRLLPEVVIGPGCVIGEGCKIGPGTQLAANVTLYHDVKIGAKCLIHSGAVIGADGFGFARSPEGWHKIAQLGGVEIGDQVEIGANTCIDRGALHDTVIESGVIIDNLVQIAHNCRVGKNTAIAGCVGIAGSTQIGPNCTIAGQAGLAGHLELVAGTHVGMQAQVTRSIQQAGSYASGTGLWPQKQWLKWVARMRRGVSKSNK